MKNVLEIKKKRGMFQLGVIMESGNFWAKFVKNSRILVEREKRKPPKSKECQEKSPCTQTYYTRSCLFADGIQSISRQRD